MTAVESSFWFRCLIMLFAEAACKPFAKCERCRTPMAANEAFQACRGSSACKPGSNEKENDNPEPKLRERSRQLIALLLLAGF